jgi:hypothetical protein
MMLKASQVYSKNCFNREPDPEGVALLEYNIMLSIWV